jgi:hypothetical protein
LVLFMVSDFYFGVRYITIAGLLFSFLLLACYSLFKFVADFNISINRIDKGGSADSEGVGVTSTAANSCLSATRGRNSDAGQEATIYKTKQCRSNITFVDVNQRLQRFYRRQQRVGEVVVDYATALCDLAEMAFDFGGARYEKVVIDQFISGLANREIRRWMKNERHTTFRETLSTAIKYESEFDDEDCVDDSGFDGSFTLSKQNSRCSSPEARKREFCDSAVIVGDSFSKVRSLTREFGQALFEKSNVGVFDAGVYVGITRIVERNGGREVVDVAAPRIDALISSEHEEEAANDLSQLFLVESADENVVEEEEEELAYSDENEAADESDDHVSPIVEDEQAMPEVCLTVVDFSPIIEDAVKVDVYEEEQELVAELEAQLKQESGDIGVVEQGERQIVEVGIWKEGSNGLVGQTAKLVVEVGHEFSVVNQRGKEGRVAQRWPKLKDKPPDFINVLFDRFIFVV